MENRKLVTIKKCAFAFVALFNLVNLTTARQVYAYEIGTHMGITKEIARFYNANFPARKIGDLEMAAMLQGSKDEDDAPRWMNHFYDPVYNRGLTNFFGTNWMSSKQWANDRAEQLSTLYNPATQTTLSTFLALTNPDALLATDYTWRRSLEDYARGDTTRAFRGLGHVLHLLEDASVPDHTRNDPHPAVGEKDYLETGSPYELWTRRFDESNINLLQYLYTKKPIALDSRDAYFDAMASYSNNNFYSKDTIDVAQYENPSPDYTLSVNGLRYGFKKDSENGDYRLVFYKNYEEQILSEPPKNREMVLTDPENDRTLRDYWERLAPKAVQYGAGLVDLFLKEAEQLKNDPSFSKEKPKSPLAQVVDAVRGLFGGAEEAITSADSVNLSVGQAGLSRDGLKEVAIIPLGSPAQTPRAATAPSQPTAPSSEAAKPLAVAIVHQTPTSVQSADSAGSPQAERPNFAPPKPARFAGALGLSANAPLQPLPAPTVCAYATGQPAASAQGFGEPTPSRNKLILNEIAWMGSTQSASDEWMELKNTSGNALDVSGWQIVDSGDQIHVTLPPNTVIPAGGLFLLERTDDDTVPTIAGDHIYVGILGNKNDGVRLFDNNCLLQDEVSGNPWPAGESGTKRTMERAIDMMWYTSSGTGPSGILGTPKMENSTRQAAQINLSRQALGSAPPLPPQETATVASSAVTHIVISEVQAGTDAGSDDEFIELYNPTANDVALTGWYLKKKTSSGAESSLVVASRLEGKTIPAHGYLLLVNEGGYRGSVTSDVTWAKSNTIAYTNNAVVLYDASDAKVDEASWTETTKGQSMERKAVENGACVSASGAGAFLGNGCDADSTGDFETRAAPQPQNRASLPEPRSGVSVTNFQSSYDKATQRVALLWDAAADARGSTSTVQYALYDVSAATTTLFLGNATTYAYRVSDVGRSYDYALTATDAGGLTGGSSRVTVTAQSPITALKFFNNPNAGTTDARIFLTFDAYPLLTQRVMSTWQILVFSLNATPVRQATLRTSGSWTPDNRTNLLAVTYRDYGSWRTHSTLILPDDPTRVGSSGGIDNYAMRWSDIETGKLMIRHDPPAKAFTSADYLTVSMYDFGGSGGGNQWFLFAAADNTKYYFTDVAPVSSPPTSPTDAAVDRYDAARSEAIIGWNPVSTDPDGMNRDIGYEINRATSTAVERFPDAEWVRFTRGASGSNSPNFLYTFSFAVSGETYVFGVRAVDEFGYVSSVATTSAYTVP